MTTTISVDVQLTVGATGAAPGSVIVEPNSTVEWVNDSQTFPNFVIAFLGSSPTSAGSTFDGSVDDAVEITVSHKQGIYHYVIEHRDAKRVTRNISGPFPFSVHQCGACP